MSITEYSWLIELFPEHEVIAKRMFGGMAYYFQGKMVLVMMASPGERSYKNLKFNFDVWNGLLFPLDREFHEMIRSRYPVLINHPVLGKWFYLPFDTEDFDSISETIVKDIARGSMEWGIWPKQKVKKERVRITKISHLKNLGPISEKVFLKAGVKSVAEFKKLGWKKVFLKIIAVEPKYLNMNEARALIGAQDNTDWRQINTKKLQDARVFVQKIREQSSKKANKKKIATSKKLVLKSTTKSKSNAKVRNTTKNKTSSRIKNVTKNRIKNAAKNKVRKSTKSL